jgi:hypothetical protein
MLIRGIRNIVHEMLVQYGQVEKKRILIIEDDKNPIDIQKSKLCTYIHLSQGENSTIQ